MAEAGALKQATTRDFLSVVFRQLWVIVTVFMIAVVSVVIVTLKTPTVYESSSRVLVNRGRKQSVLQPTLQVLTWEEETSSEIETVKSLPVAERAQKLLDDWVKAGKIDRRIRLARSGVDAGVLNQSNVIEITYTNKDAESCVPVTNAVTQAYMDFRRASGTVPLVHEFFTREIGQVDSAMTDVLRRREDYLRTTGTIAPNEEQSGLFNLMNTAEGDLANVQAQLRVLEQQLGESRRILAQPGVPDPAYFISNDLGNQANLTSLKQRWNDLRVERDALAPKQTPEHPELMGVINSLAEVEAQIREEAKVSVQLLESRRAMLTEKAHTLQGLVDNYRIKLEAIPHKEIALDNFDHEMTTLRDRYKELVGKEIQARISQATSPDLTVTLFSPASRPKALRTTDYVRLALAPILSLVVGLMLAFFLDSLDHSLKSSSDIEEFLGIPVLAALPETKG